MRKLTLGVAGLILMANPAFAQMGGMGGGMGGHGGQAIDPAGDSPDQSGTYKRRWDVEPVSQEKFDKVVAAMFARADVNHDGMVTLAELQSQIDARREAVIRDRFKQIDTNHDGKIDAGEFIAWQQAMGSAAASDCSAYAGQGEIVPDTLGPELGYSDKDRALAIAIEPLSPMVITRANIHYRAGITLDDLLAYENARFTAADTNHDGYLEQEEIAALRHDGHAMGGHHGHEGGPEHPAN